MIYHTHPNYMPSLDGLSEDIHRAVATLTPLYGTFDGLVAQGLSGVIPAVPVSLALHVDLVIVRKPDDSAHETRHINLDRVLPGTRWIFLDDFISGGATRKRCQQAICAAGGQIVGQYLCREQEYDSLELYSGDLGPEAPGYTPALPTFSPASF